MEEKKREKFLAEWIAFGIFVIASIVVTIFHEPCYEEIQAWMIAKEASYYDILFLLPHFEGHPPIWHLLLSIFAKTGVPMNIGLFIVPFTFSTFAMWLLMFKAPFQKWVRILIPFTYFFFYQYHIVSRPYAIMILAFVLMAMFYTNRNQKPLRYVASLYLLCLTSAYGILIAACLCVVWTIEIIVEMKGKEFAKKAITDRRTWCLFGILVMAIVLYYIINPADTAYAQMSMNHDFSKLKGLVYMFFIAPGDALITDISLMGNLQQSGNLISLNYVTYMCVGASLIISSILVIFVGLYKKLHVLLVPYLAFGLFGGLVYFYNHHIGIIALFTMFILWICLANPPAEIVLPKWMQKIEEKNKGLIQKLGKLALYVCILMSLFWNIVACKNEIIYPSWYAEDMARVIEDYDIDDMSVCAQWIYQPLNKEETSDDTSETNIEVEAEVEVGATNAPEVEAGNDGETDENIIASIDLEDRFKQKKAEDYIQYVRMCNYVDILAYSDKNYIYDFNDGKDDVRYINHDMLSQEESLEYLKELGKQGYPEIIIGNPDILGMMGLDINEYGYIPIYNFRCYRINKYNTIYATDYIYAREDIFNSRTDWPIFRQMEEDLGGGN